MLRTFTEKFIYLKLLLKDIMKSHNDIYDAPFIYLQYILLPYIITVYAIRIIAIYLSNIYYEISIMNNML